MKSLLVSVSVALAAGLAVAPAAFAQKAPDAAKAAENASSGAALAKGMTVKDASGSVLGTISKISRKSDGSVREVLVTAHDGETHYRMAGAALTVSGDVAVTA